MSCPQPIIDEHIKFREVVDDASGEVAGNEEVYVPLQEDPNVPTTTTIVRHPLGTNETLVYQTMSLHALYLTRNADDQRPTIVDHLVHTAFAHAIEGLVILKQMNNHLAVISLIKLILIYVIQSLL